MKISDTSLEYIIEMAAKCGYKKTGNILVDAQTELMLTRFAYMVAQHLEVKDPTPPV